MLMFQQNSARAALRLLEAAGQVHVADRLGRRVAQMRRRPGSPRRSPRLSAPLRYRKPGARPARGCRSPPAAARPRAPRCRRVGWRWKPWPIHSSDGPAPYIARGSLDQLGRDAGDALAPRRRAVVQQRLELVEADRVRVQRSARSSSPSRRDHVQRARTRARRRCPGTAAGAGRPRAAVGGADRVDDDHLRRRPRAASARAGGAPTPTGWRPTRGCRPRRRAVRGSKPSSELP